MDRETFNNIILVISGTLSLGISICVITYWIKSIRNNKIISEQEKRMTINPLKKTKKKKDSVFHTKEVSLDFSDMTDVVLNNAVDDHNFQILDDFEKMGEIDEKKMEILKESKKKSKKISNPLSKKFSH